MANRFLNKLQLKYGTPVRIRKGAARKPWEWIGHIQMVSGDTATILWRMVRPGSEGARAITHRNINDLEILEGVVPGYQG